MDRVESWWSAACAAYPSVDVAIGAYRAAAERRLAEGVAPDELHATDLYLSVGCELGADAAVRQLEHEHVARVPEWLARCERDPAVLDEVKQRVRTRVLTAEPGQPPRIATYSARGPLGAWLRVVALREHASLRRGDLSDDLVAPETLDAIARSGALSPELVALKDRFAPVISAALAQAIGALPSRERALLRMCYVEQLPLEAIGRIYRVNKSTVSRWLAAARLEVLDAIRAVLHAEADGTDAELESLLGLVRSRLELSLGGLL